MTDDQFDRMLSVQLAQVAALESISTTLLAIASSNGIPAPENDWKRVKALLKVAKAVAQK